MERFLPDTNIALYLLGGRLAEPLKQGRYAISVITELELLSYPDLNEREADRIKSFLQEVDITPLTEGVKDNTIRLRRQLRFKLPDAIIATTALYLDAALLTNDKRLLNSPGIRSQNLKLL